MDRSTHMPLRALPRVFLPKFPFENESIELPKHEYEKFSKVLRLKSGDEVAVLPNNLKVIRCRLSGRNVIPIEVVEVNNEVHSDAILLLALSKPDRIETVLRMGTELGIKEFVLFPSDRSVIRWDKEKRVDRINRFQVIIQEAAEQSYRTVLPNLKYLENLEQILTNYPRSWVLNEGDWVQKKISDVEINAGVIGPEGGWSPREMQLIESRSLTLGKRILRVDTAAITVASWITKN